MPKGTVVPKLHEIESSLLTNIIDEEGHQTELFVGRGYFGIVRIQLCRNINVAVKEFLPHTVTSDVKIEANILARFSHPYLPYLFGIVIKELPYQIVMQYHGISGLRHRQSTIATINLRPLDWISEPGKATSSSLRSFRTSLYSLSFLLRSGTELRIIIAKASVA